MDQRFDYFVVFAEMRTGSNFLEANINEFEGLTCHGEAFNPHFIGYPRKDDLLGITLEARTEDPMQLIAAVKADQGVAGFRYFHDHDPRVLDSMLADPRCAKIVLTRNPLDSYVSWKIAKATGQWKLTDVRRRKDSTVQFDGAEFKQHVEALQAFQVQIMRALQTSGQTAFYVAYEDLQDVEVMNGLARFLGHDATIDAVNKKLKPQNPAALSEKVENFAEIPRALEELDRFNLSRTPNFEPRRGAAVPNYVACAVAPLLYLPIPSGPKATVTRWMAGLDHVEVDGLIGNFSQKTLRQWKKANRHHRSFTVVRHPVARVHAAFCEQVLSADEGIYKKIRHTLRRVYKMPIPKDPPQAEYDAEAHRAAFLAFLSFVKANLLGQTSLRQDGHWGSQAVAMKGFANLALPDMVVRESEMESYLPALAMQVGRLDAADPVDVVPDHPVPLSAIYDEEIEALVQDIYKRDYITFGFDRWQ
ncbi:sulfotransferase family 2 domain-containing protein [Shimia sp. MMG029]|uniref:sulfotransferase family 2 domain-containing protein n=1 Tax=Shimia sp. MMG029 TaxID=3021978 RepID=UPI0022FDD1E2|nr:sulfotransferase family 2 domain-containing protein [Shimia sp. MMG029]MDA5556863.1 sulfotransferase family 2 domain-containing protein [Shimia sp. MMG029]